MATVVKNNLSALNTLNRLNVNNTELAKSLKKVSSGMRINGAGDDASGYSIGTKMEVMMRSLGQDIDNTKTGRNLVKTAEGGIQEIINNIREMKEMALNSANDHNSDVDREIIQKDFSAHMRTIADIAATTNYDGRLLLNGDYSEPHWVSRVSSSGGVAPVDPIDPTADPTALTRITAGFSLIEGREVAPFASRVGLTASRAFGSSYSIRIGLDFTGVRMKATGDVPSCPAAFDGKGFSVLCSGCKQYIDIQFDASTTESTYIQHASSTISWARKYVIGIKDVTDAAALPEAIFLGIKNASGRTEEALRGCYLDSDGKKIDGADFPAEYYQTAVKDSADGNSISIDGEHNLRIMKDGDSYMLYRDGGVYMGLYDGLSDDDPPIPPPPPPPDPVVEEEYIGNPLIIHTGAKANQHLRVYINSMHPIAMGLNRAAVNPQDRAIESLDIIDRALEYALNENTRMGAYQVRLNETEDNLVTAEENTTSSMSQMRDADMAKEMMIYTKNNVLTQSAQSMLSQANQNTGGVLDLLQ